KREFRALADVVHPNLVGLHELVSDGRTWFLTMEFVDGVPFLEHVHTDPRRLRPALDQLAAGISAIHAAGRLPRDLSPSNALVARDGRVVVLDFGLAAELLPGGLQQSTDSNIVGSAGYMSPEQASGKPLSPASDWYSFGVMLFESLTGKLPFRG